MRRDLDLTVVTVSVRSYRATDHDEAIKILVDAFEDDPSFRRVTPLARGLGHRETLERMLSAQIRRHYIPHGRIDVAVDGETDDATPLGVALWSTPDDGSGPVEKISALKDWVSLFGRHAATAVLRDRQESSFEPRFAHWYLYTLAVSPAAQRRGVGTALLNHGLERAGNDAVYLEASTPDAANLYERLGFVPMGRLPKHGEGVHEMGMWRPPVIKARKPGRGPAAEG